MSTAELLYQKITDDLRRAIDGGKYKPGEKIPSVSELREAYTVSHITVMRAYKELSSSGYIFGKRSCGYFVCEQLAATPLTGRIGNFVRPLRAFEAHDNYFNDINVGIQQEACRLHFNLLNHYSANNVGDLPICPGGQEEILEAMHQCAAEVDGFLVDERVCDSILAPELEKLGKPLVIVNRPSGLAAGSVSPPNYDGMTEMLRFAARQSYSHWVFCEMNMRSDSERERCRAFDDFVAANGISASHMTNTTVNPWEETRRSIDEIRAAHTGESVLFVTPANYTGRDFADYLAGCGVHFGVDAGVVSFEKLEMAGNTSPRLSTVGYQAEEIGRQAVALLRELLNNPTLRRQSIVRTVNFFIIPGETL